MGAITLISSLLLSFSYSSLKQLTDANIRFDIKRNIVKSAGYNIKKMSKDEIIQNYTDNVKEIILDTNNQKVLDVKWDELVGVEDKKNGLTYFVNKKDKIKLIEVESDYFSKEYFAKRPPNERLINRKLDLRKINIMRDWKVALKEYLEDYYSDYLN